jgi:hypothetical protein
VRRRSLEEIRHQKFNRGRKRLLLIEALAKKKFPSTKSGMNFKRVVAIIVICASCTN